MLVNYWETTLSGSLTSTISFYMSVFARMGNQIVLDVALYPGDTIRILILYGKLNRDLELQMAK